MALPDWMKTVCTNASSELTNLLYAKIKGFQVGKVPVSLYQGQLLCWDSENGCLVPARGGAAGDNEWVFNREYNGSFSIDHHMTDQPPDAPIRRTSDVDRWYCQRCDAIVPVRRRHDKVWCDHCGRRAVKATLPWAIGRIIQLEQHVAHLKAAAAGSTNQINTLQRIHQEHEHEKSQLLAEINALRDKLKSSQKCGTVDIASRPRPRRDLII